MEITKNVFEKGLNTNEKILALAIEASEKAINYFFSLQKPDGHWCGELESNMTITSEYVFLRQILGIKDKRRNKKIIKYLFKVQKSDGSWSNAYNCPGDLSTTAEAYLALTLLGINKEDPRLKNAEHFILSQGGLKNIRIFTRIHFALFGLFPWRAIPVLPPEFILLPATAPVNVYSLSSWARITMVPLLMIHHYKPVFALPNGKYEENSWLDHLWAEPEDKKVPYVDPLKDVVKETGISWKTLFTGADRFLWLYDHHLKSEKIREIALSRCEQWLLERIEDSGDIAGIFPPMANGIIALYARGFSIDEGPIKKILSAIETFAWEDKSGFRMQACVSPVWDTVLGMIGLLDCNVSNEDPRLKKATEWVLDKQIKTFEGDWKVYNSKVPQSYAWSFEYENTFYPDVDDTAVVLMALLKQNPDLISDKRLLKSLRWIVSMQNKDGGFAAFDVDNDKTYLNQMPFSDMNSLCDPSSPDLAGRVLEVIGHFGKDFFPDIQKRAIEFLINSQEPQGSWYGRWGVNYIYGTSIALTGLSKVGISKNENMITKALDWLIKSQNTDGGWGELLETYKDKSLMGRGPSTASQTSWALLGLMAFLPADHVAIQKGVVWLLEKQKVNGPNGTWEEKEFTGTGFPNHFYLRYHMYCHYFPMMAIGRFIQNCSINK